MTEQQYLENLLAREKIPDYVLEQIRATRAEIESYLRSYFWSKIENFYYSWSIARWTAVFKRYDTDLCVYFWNSSFDTLQEMYSSMKYALNKKYVVKEQRVSIGLPTMNIDVVPWRKINNDGVINLWDNQSKTWTQTNIVKHKNIISQDWDKDIIRLLKLWKIEHDIDIKSFALELLSISALKNCTSTWLWDRLRHVWRYISDKDIYSIQIIDPSNSSNNIMNSVEDLVKEKLKNQALLALTRPYWWEIIW